ncbi:MAG TPA: hypothetical protein VGB44_02805 [Flavobacterium sp.]
MRKLFYIIFLLLTTATIAQTRIELTTRGFSTIEVPRPEGTIDELIEASRAWANEYRHEQPSVHDITSNSLKITAIRNNAFFYRNVGETFRNGVGYTLSVTFTATTCRISFSVNDIYERNALKEMEITDYFTSDGRPKEDFEDVKPSLEETVNNLVNSYLSYISS